MEARQIYVKLKIILLDCCQCLKEIGNMSKLVLNFICTCMVQKQNTSGYRASTMSHQAAPPPPTGSPPPLLYDSITFTHLEENYCIVQYGNYHTYVKKQGGNPLV
jgi:hypothetical protein